LARSRLLGGGGGEVINPTLLLLFREAEAEVDAKNPADDEDGDVLFGRIGVEKDIRCGL
jgi:hypothetical protein